VANSFVRRALTAYIRPVQVWAAGEHGVCAGAFARNATTLHRHDLQLDFINWGIAARDGQEVRAHPFPGFSVDVVHLCPQARGSVKLENPDPFVAPEICCSFLRQRKDVEVLTAGVRLVRKIVQQPALSGYVAEEIAPGSDITTDSGPVRSIAWIMLHDVGVGRLLPSTPSFFGTITVSIAGGQQPVTPSD
jgi:choline dehydrogenase